MPLLRLSPALASAAHALACCALPVACAAAVPDDLPQPATPAAESETAQPMPTAPESAVVPKALAKPPAPSGPRWEGAIGLLAAQRPEYAGADRRVLKFTPGFFLRYGRLTVTNVSGFRTRNEGEVARGASLDLLSNPRMHLSLALRLDRGRDEGSAAAFRGLGDVRTTVRLHTNFLWRLGGPLSLGVNWNLDALGKGGGHGGSLGLGWDTPLGPRSAIHWYGGVSLAGDRYMQSYFGVTPEQAAVSGYPVYRPRAGLRAGEISVNYRTDLSSDWLLIAGASASHLLGPAAESPLTRRLDGWEVRTGVAWRF